MLWTLLWVAACAQSPEETLLERGMTAQRGGDLDAALAAYDACIEADAGAVRCRWERGWTHWTRGDWDAVVADWEAVAAAEPAFPELDRWLPQARRHQEAMAAWRLPDPSAPATVARPAPARTLRLRAVGDVMLGTTVPAGHQHPGGATAVLANVGALLADADLTFVNLEGPLCDGGTTDKCDDTEDPAACWAFRSPTGYARVLAAAGVDLASLANNHAGDFGDACRRETEATLTAAGIAWSGPPGTVAQTEVDGEPVAMIAFHTSPVANWALDLDGAARLVRAVSARHTWTIVSVHGGAEGAGALHVPTGPETYHGENRGDLRRFARAVVAAGADLVIGHGPHVPRGLELVDGRLVAYSLGNFATYGRFTLSGPNGVTAVLEATLDGDGALVSGRLIPVRQVGRGVPEPDPTAAVVGLVRTLSREDFGDAAPEIAADGTFAPR